MLSKIEILIKKQYLFVNLDKNLCKIEKILLY